MILSLVKEFDSKKIPRTAIIKKIIKNIFVFTEVSQKSSNISVTYLLYSPSGNKNSYVFEEEAIMLYHLKSTFWQFFDAMFLFFMAKNSFMEASTLS